MNKHIILSAAEITHDVCRSKPTMAAKKTAEVPTQALKMLREKYTLSEDLLNAVWAISSAFTHQLIVDKALK